jgi:CDGSH-type Zn-finger protein
MVKLQSAKDMSACWCGRSKTGQCDGSHTFTEEQWAEVNLEFDPEKFKNTASESWLNRTQDDDDQFI